MYKNSLLYCNLLRQSDLCLGIYSIERNIRLLKRVRIINNRIMILLIAMNNLNAVFIKIMAKLEYSAEK